MLGVSNISQQQKEFIQKGFLLNLRNDGRTNLQLREKWISRQTIMHANSSCTLEIMSAQTKYFVGIKLELQSIKTPCIEISLNSLESTPIAVINSLTDLVQDHFISHFDLSFLTIPMSSKSWKVNIDVMSEYQLQLVDIESLSIAVKIALADLEIPEVVVTVNVITEEEEIQLNEQKIFRIEKEVQEIWPVLCVIGEYKQNIILDISKEESFALNELYLIVSNNSNDIFQVQKLGLGITDPQFVLKVIAVAAKFLQIMKSNQLKIN